MLLYANNGSLTNFWLLITELEVGIPITREVVHTSAQIAVCVEEHRARSMTALLYIALMVYLLLVYMLSEHLN